MKNNYKQMILEKIKKSGITPLPYKKLLRSCKVLDKDFKDFTRILEGLKKKGEIIEQRDGFLLPKHSNFINAKVTRLNKTFGFVKSLVDDSEIFIPGKFLKGAMPGDIVLIKTFEGRGSSLEGEVVNIVEENFSQFTGNIVFEHGEYAVLPDILSNYALPIDNPESFDLKEGDKVLASVTHRGQRHSEHSCKLINNFGSSLKASVCALSVLELNGISPIFEDEVLAEAERITDYESIQTEAPNRLDLRSEPIFTIDGADTKDIDDAISIKKLTDGYELGVV